MDVKKSMCLAATLVFSTASLLAQRATDYIKWRGEKETFGVAYRQWKPGQPLFPGAAEDENFFISRIKYRERFTNQNTQVDKTRTKENDKNVINWVPIGTTDANNQNALPSGIFDSDAFSMWSYLTHYGNWTAPMVQIPGAFMDIVHKNGVTTSALASVPWAYNINPREGHGYDLSALYEGGADKFISLLKQYGVDGWGMNSEFKSPRSFATQLQDFMADVYEKAITGKQWPQYSAAWYTLVNNDGNLEFADGLTRYNINWYHKDGRGVSNYVFGNYNWNKAKLALNDQLTKEVGRDPREIYAGMNLQGGEGKYWTDLMNSKTSIGLWGAHNRNMFFESRNEAGSAPEVLQRTYLSRTEGFFTNGHRNPARKIEVKDGLGIGLGFLKDFHGVSAFSTAKSSLQWSLDEMPFYSFFNLGNGKFFNINGVTVRDAGWYNIAMQDYLPTWRYWFSKKYLGSEAADVEGLGLSATFTWEDAWFGGSALELKGTASEEYFHLFKTKFALKEGDVIRIRYKFNAGSAKLSLVGSAEGTESTAVSATIVNAEDIELSEWTTKEFKVASSGIQNFRLAGKTLAAVALKFEDAKDVDLLIGEFSIQRGSVEKPVTPIINKMYTKLYDYNYKGIDAKIVFDMPRPSGMTEGEHIYNEDVKTSYFKYYAQQKGGQETFMGATTSWAALCFSAPFDPAGAKEVRLGVRAVGLDGVTEGDIQWSDYIAVGGELKISNEVRIDKPVIKPQENFKVGYVDPNHAAADWIILDNKTKTEIASFKGVKSFSTKLDKVGLYDLKVTVAGEEPKVYVALIQVSSNEVGAMPQITDLTFNTQPTTGEVKGEKDKVNTVTYQGKAADGKASRGLNLQENPMAVFPDELMTTVSSRQSFTYAFWVKFNSLAGGSIQLLNIRNPSTAWPLNNWGYVWTLYTPGDKTHTVVLRSAEGKGHYQQFYHLDVAPGAWTHLAYAFEYTNEGTIKIHFYVNGKRVQATSHKREGDKEAKNGDKVEGWPKVTTLTAADNIMFGGSAHGRAGVDGVVDDVKFFTEALTEEQVAAQMYASNPKTAPGGVSMVGYWSFEQEPNAENYFETPGRGSRLAVGGMIAGEKEGQNKFAARPAAFEAGSPFITGESYPVTTTAKWVFPRGVVANANGSDVKGSAEVTYKKIGTFTGRLILQNSWGKDERVIEGITITDPGAIETTDEISLAAFPNPFVEAVNIRFATAGKYMVSIYDLSGNLVNSRSIDATAGSIVTVGVDAPAGIYLLRVQTTEGKLLQTLKLQKN